MVVLHVVGGCPGHALSLIARRPSDLGLTHFPLSTTKVRFSLPRVSFILADAMRASVTLLIGVVALGGCGSSGGTWTKAGVTEQEQKRDTLDCLDQARAMVASPQGPRPTVDQDRYRDCMANRGYTMGAGTK